MRIRRTATASVLAVLAVMLMSFGQAAIAEQKPFAPLNRPGPKLSVKTATLKAALKCSGSFTANKLEPVLLSPGTGTTPDQNFSWNYERAFTAQHRPWCAVTMPHHALGEMQSAGEYLVYGIRTMHAKAHRRIAILGHSQGGMSMRWALRFWPDTRPMVDDVIGLAGDNHGTTVVSGLCNPGKGKCTPAQWQQTSTANYVKAMNSRAETFAGISYTEVFSHTDEVVQPNLTDQDSTSALHTGKGRITNVSTQDICPLDVNEHLLIGTIDPAAYALSMDALTHDGPAKPARISRSVCAQVYQPGVDPLEANTYLQIIAVLPGLLSVSLPGINLVGAPEVSNEPTLRCYVYSDRCR
jgi:hypothetical protein